MVWFEQYFVAIAMQLYKYSTLQGFFFFTNLFYTVVNRSVVCQVCSSNWKDNGWSVYIFGRLESGLLA